MHINNLAKCLPYTTHSVQAGCFCGASIQPQEVPETILLNLKERKLPQSITIATSTPAAQHPFLSQDSLGGQGSSVHENSIAGIFSGYKHVFLFHAEPSGKYQGSVSVLFPTQVPPGEGLSHGPTVG